MSLPKIAPPFYRIAARDGAFVGGLMRPMGAELAWEAWPPHGLEPVNDTAARIAVYYRKSQAIAGFPRSPRHVEHGLYLPGVLPRFGAPVPNSIVTPKGSEILGLVAESDLDRGLPTPPEYAMIADHRIGRRDLKRGERFHFIGWPITELFAPVNAPAHEVAAYFARHHENSKLLGGPWCCLRGLFLPPLAEPQRDGKPLPLDRVKYADAIAAEIANVKPTVPITGPPVTTRSGFTTGVSRLPASALLNAGDQE